MAMDHWVGSWYYQKCTEFAWFHTFDAPNEVFGKKVTPELFIKVDIICKLEIIFYLSL
jgi:hypothetical protein